MIYETNNYSRNFQQFEAIGSFGDSFINGKTALGEPDKKQSNLLRNILEFSDRAKSRVKTNKKKKSLTDNPQIQISINKRESRVTFKIKARFYLEVLTAETTKLSGTTEKRQPKIEIVKCYLS